MKWSSAGRRVEVLSLDRTALTGAYGVVVLLLFQPNSTHITSLSMNNYGITGKHARQCPLFAGPFHEAWIRMSASVAYPAGRDRDTQTAFPPVRGVSGGPSTVDDSPGRYPRGIGLLSGNSLNCKMICKSGGACDDPVQKN
jgi:hypothetical protein